MRISLNRKEEQVSRYRKMFKSRRLSRAAELPHMHGICCSQKWFTEANKARDLAPQEGYDCQPDLNFSSLRKSRWYSENFLKQPRIEGNNKLSRRRIWCESKKYEMKFQIRIKVLLRRRFSITNLKHIEWYFHVICYFIADIPICYFIVPTFI